MTQLHRYLLGAALVVAAAMLMVFGSIQHNSWLAAWALMVNQAAVILIVWLLMERCHAKLTNELNLDEAKVEGLITALHKEADSGPKRMRP